MARIVEDHAPALKKAGFRKRRHSFNRDARDGLVHVVHFWMAPKEPPAWTEIGSSTLSVVRFAVRRLAVL